MTGDPFDLVWLAAAMLVFPGGVALVAAIGALRQRPAPPPHDRE